MEISNCEEVLLLCEALHNNLHTNYPCKFYELLDDIFIGLSHQHKNYEATFWKTKITYILLSYTLKSCENIEFSNLKYMEGYKCTLSWEELFEIVIKRSLLPNLSSLILSTSSTELFVFVAEKFESFCKGKVEYVDFVIYLTFCVGELYTNNELNENEYIDICSKEIMRLIEELPAIQFRDNFDFESLVKATEMFDNKHRGILESETKVSVIDFEKFQTLLNNAEAEKKKLSKLIDNENEIFQTKSSIEIHEVKKICSDVIKALMKIWVTSLSDEPNEEKEKINKSIKIFLGCLSNTIVDISSAAINENAPESKMEINFDLAIFITKNNLKGCCDATIYLINGLLSQSYSKADIEKCYKCFEENSENLLQIDHLTSLVKFTSTIADVSFFKKWKKLVLKCFEKLFTDMKMKVLSIVLTKDFQERFETFFSANNNMENEFTRQINVKFNTVSCLDSLNSDKRMLKVVCESCFICPSYAIKKFIELILYQDEHTHIFVNSILKIPLLSVYATGDEGSVLVYFMMQKIMSDKREKILERAINFLLKFLELSLTHYESGDLNVAEFVLNDVLERYIFTFLATPIDQKLVVVVVTYISGVYNLKRFDLLDLFQQLGLSYFLARILDSSEYPDNISETLKESLHLIVEAACLKYSESDTKLLTWFLNVSKSLSWKTQLYLRPLLCKHANYKTCLPKSVTEICQHDFSIEILDNCTEGTGLTVWFQCMIINPGLLPISSLILDNFSAINQELFGHGVIVALTQILSECTEQDWQVIINSIQALLDQNILNIQCDNENLKTLPLFDLSLCKVPISIAVILHRVTGLLSSRCCERWMTLSKWNRLSRNYSIAMKSLLLVKSNPADLFCMFNLFSYAVDFLALLETIAGSEKCVNSVFVLCLDLLTVFGRSISSFHDLSKEDEALKYEYCVLLNDAIRYKTAMMSMVEIVTNQNFEDTLAQKLLNILPA